MTVRTDCRRQRPDRLIKKKGVGRGVIRGMDRLDDFLIVQNWVGWTQAQLADECNASRPGPTL